MNSSMSKCKHANIFKDLLMPFRMKKCLMHLWKCWKLMRMRFLLKVVAFIGWIKATNVLLTEDLEIMKDYYHSYLDLSLLVIQEKHEIYLHFLYGITESGSILCFTFELLFRFYPSDCSKDIYNRTMFFI